MQTFSDLVTVECRRDAKRLTDVTDRAFLKRSLIPDSLLFAAAVSLLPFGYTMLPGAPTLAGVPHDIYLLRQLT